MLRCYDTRCYTEMKKKIIFFSLFAFFHCCYFNQKKCVPAIEIYIWCEGGVEVLVLSPNVHTRYHHIIKSLIDCWGFWKVLYTPLLARKLYFILINIYNFLLEQIIINWYNFVSLWYSFFFFCSSDKSVKSSSGTIFSASIQWFFYFYSPTHSSTFITFCCDIRLPFKCLVFRMRRSIFFFYRNLNTDWFVSSQRLFILCLSLCLPFLSSRNNSKSTIWFYARRILCHV